MNDTAHWLDCIRAFLHDPPDKALDVKGHEQRAQRYQNAAFDVPGDPVRAGATKPADWLAAAIERLPLPRGTLRDCDGNPLDPVLEQPFNRIPRENLERTSPINGASLTNATTVFRQAQDLSSAIIDQRAARIQSLAQANPDPRLRALALWRLLPETLPHVCALPGDTRLTDHSIIDHADAAMSACAALREGGKASLLVFSVGPVQAFIVQGRSLRDLWTGSYLLSWLTAAAMRPILERLGPWAITSPGLRGNTLTDHWLEGQGLHRGDGSPFTASRPDLRWAGLPNTFTALVPTAQADDLVAAVRKACFAEWDRICASVHAELRSSWGNDGWDLHWEAQCQQVWDVRAVTLPFLSVTDSGSVPAATKHLRELAQNLLGDLPQPVVDVSRIAECLQKANLAPGYVTPDSQGLWMLANDLAQRLMAADKTARQVPPHAHPEDSREKCVLFPGFAVMGPNGDTNANKAWWRGLKPVRLAGMVKTSERLSAPGLVKRYAFGAYFADLLGRDAFRDTRSIAFGHWLAEFKRRVPDGTLHWENWRKVVAGINYRAADELEAEWTAHELLDPGQMSAITWVHPAADETMVRKELQHAQRKRQDLLISRAKEVHLPEPKPYYAILVADGDHMGKYLRGESGPTFEQAYHPWMVEKLRDIGADLSRVRPQGMAAQLAFSGALSDFTRKAGETIAKHHGTCVYAGGDDVLAVLPVATALLAAKELAHDFSTYVPGATLSAGLAIVHCQEDLRSAIGEARQAEQLAKSTRNALGCRIARRSGDTTEALAPWALIPDWHRMSTLLASRSDRWIHHLEAERDSLKDLPREALWARIRHHLLHGEEGQRQAKDLGTLFDQVRTAWGDSGDASDFLTWCQHAAWLAKFHPTTPATESAP